MIRLHGFFRSSSTHRCRIALNLKGLQYDTKVVDLRVGGQHSDSFKTLNPHQAVPVLVAGELVLTQSLAIMEWLEDRYPEPALLPAGAHARAAVRSACQLFACDVQPLHNLRVLNYLRQPFGKSETEIAEWCRHWIRSGLSVFESMVSVHGAGADFAFGDSPGMADACLAPQLFAARRFELDLSGLSCILRLAESYAGHPAFVAAEPARQPDAV